MDKRYVIHTLIVALIFFSATSVFPGRARTSEVECTAIEFLKRRNVTNNHTLNKEASYHIEKVKPLIDPSNNSEFAYIVNLKPKGFILVSKGNEEMGILAYSFRNNWDHEIDAEDKFYNLITKSFIKREASKRNTFKSTVDRDRTHSLSQIDILDNEDRKYYQWPPEGTTKTGGWIETTWHQGYPYNMFCPKDTSTDTQCVVGCVATALAQIVHYHKDIGDLRFDDKDTYTKKGIHIDSDSLENEFLSFSNLNSYLEDIRYKFENNEILTEKEQAALSFACGVALEMNYTSSSSWPDYPEIVIKNVLINKMGYVNAEFAKKGKEGFYKILIENIINGLPVILTLNGESLSHAVVADGYRSDGFFHLNFGWSIGKPVNITDAWWNLDELFPEDFSGIANGVMNIIPDSIIINPMIEANINPVKLNCTKIGEISDSYQLGLRNTGEISITVESLFAPDNFLVAKDGEDFYSTFEPITLQPDQELKLKISCVPSYVGEIKGKLQVIASSSEVKRYLSIDLIGYGVTETGTMIKDNIVIGTWKKSGSPYYICNNIVIPDSHSLKIEPGTKISFAGMYNLSIKNKAQLIAKGIESDSIYFTALDTSQGWQGIYFDNSYLDTIDYCVITKIKNTILPINSGTITIRSASPRITNSRIINNSTTKRGGAFYLDNSSAHFNNVLICENKAPNGAAIFAYNSSPVMANVTIVHNNASQNGGAIYLSSQNNIFIKNSIIWDNYAVKGSDVIYCESLNSNNISFEYSDIDTTRLNSEILYINNEVISSNPLFNADYTLQSNSPCIDTGDPVDAVGAEPEPNGNRINMGAYGGTSRAAVAISSVIVLVEDSNPYEFHLAQNYPNPFNQTTTFAYQLEVLSHVELIVYNILGQKVETIISEVKPAGQYTIEWNAGDLASGTYFYRLTATATDGSTKNFSQVRRLVLVK